MKHYLITAAVLYVFAVHADAQTMLGRVSITGADSSAVEALTPGLLSKEGGVLNEGYIAHDSGIILGYFRENGWWNAGVEALADSGSTGVSLTFAVDPGKPAVLGDVVTTVTDGEALPFEMPELPRGPSLTRTGIESVTNALVDVYSAEGYPDIRVVPLLSARGDTVDVDFKITAGHQARIDSLMVRGLTKTRPHTVTRELSALIGKPANRQTAREARVLLASLNHVRWSGEATVAYGPGGEGILVLPLEEGSQGTFEGIVGYQPAADSDGGEIVGKADIELNNLLGTGRAAQLRWEKLGGNSEDMELAYREPWVFGMPYNVGGAFMQEEREQQGYIRTTVSGTADRRFGALGMSLGWRYEKVSADSVYSTTAQGVDAGLSWRTTDDILNPRTGARYSLDWSLVSKRFRFGGMDSSTLERLAIDLDQYIPVRDNQTVALLLRYRRADTKLSSLGPSDRYWLGGATTIRGHAESLHPAVKAFWANLEYRLLTGERSRAFLFYDSGYLVNYTGGAGAMKKSTRTVSGYGFGLRIASRAGLVGFDYGLAGGGGFADGKLHVSMRTEF